MPLIVSLASPIEKGVKPASAGTAFIDKGGIAGVGGPCYRSHAEERSASSWKTIVNCVHKQFIGIPEYAGCVR